MMRSKFPSIGGVPPRGGVVREFVNYRNKTLYLLFVLCYLFSKLCSLTTPGCAHPSAGGELGTVYNHYCEQAQRRVAIQEKAGQVLKPLFPPARG